MDEFLCDAKPVSWFDKPEVSIFQTRFDMDRYSEAAISNLNQEYGQLVKEAVVKRKSEFFAGRFCAHRSLAAWNITTDIIGIGDGRSPIWPPGFVGSISHCSAYAVAATAKSDTLFAIGLDVEDIVSSETRKELQKAIFNQNELFLLNGASNPDFIFTLIFSMKESFFKAAYPHVKTFFDFPAISMTEVDVNRGRVFFEVNQDLGSIFQSGCLFSGQFKVLENRRVITYFDVEAKARSRHGSQAFSRCSDHDAPLHESERL